jgi:hypothetical protein
MANPIGTSTIGNAIRVRVHLTIRRVRVRCPSA